MVRSLLALLCAGFCATPALAQVPCAPREDIARALAADHDEVVVGQGLTSDGQLFEVFAAENGTWTVVITNATMVSCVKASGEAWHEAPAIVTELEGPAT